MTTERIVDGASRSTNSEITLRACETSSRRAVVYVDENFVSIGVVRTASSSSTVASQRTKPDVQRLDIYKPCEMGRNVVCFRYLLVASFVLLGISGGVVCGTGSYFLHRLHGSLTLPEWYGPPAILLATGIINIILGPYFWYYIDIKYNAPQHFMFLTFVVLIAILQTAAGIWSLVSHAAVDSSISEILHEKLASIGITNDRPAWNITEIKVNCCGFDNSASTEFDDNNKISWSCCNARSYRSDLAKEDTCVLFYVNECRHLALHRYRSILFHVFVLALCAVILQIYMMICMRSYARTLKRSLKTKRAQCCNVPQSIISQPAEKTFTAVPLGPQHICEGCSSGQHH